MLAQPDALTETSSRRAGAALFRYLITDPEVVGIVSWLGLLATLVGFAVAIVQLQKVQSAALAAETAVATMTSAARRQEQSSRVSGALEAFHLADEYLRKPNKDAAAAYLFNGWGILLEARELTTEPIDNEQIEEFAAVIRQVYDEVRVVGSYGAGSVRTDVEQYMDLSRALDGLSRLSAKLRMGLSGIGVGER